MPCPPPPSPWVQKLHPLLQAHSASVGDVLLLRPLGPGRLQAQLVKADSEVGRQALRAPSCMAHMASAVSQHGMLACMACASGWLAP